MTKATRKIQRKQEKKKAKEAQKKIQEQMNMFEKIPSECLTCQKPFDKMNREDVESFRVVVRKTQGLVNLYCDSCWERATKIVEEFKKNTKLLDTK